MPGPRALSVHAAECRQSDKGTQTLLNSFDDAKLLGVDLFREYASTRKLSQHWVLVVMQSVVSGFDEALSAHLEKVAQNDLAVSLVTENTVAYTR